MRKLFALPALLLVLTCLASADTQFNFTYSDPEYLLQGVLTASPNGGGIYTATGVSGTVTWLLPNPTQTYALLLVPPGAVPQNHNGDNIYGQDDLLYPNNPDHLLTIDPNYFGIGGIEFVVPAPPPLVGYNGGSNLAIFANGGGDYGIIESANLGGYNHIRSTGGVFTLTAVPEPDAVILLIAMMAGLAVLAPALRKTCKRRA